MFVDKFWQSVLTLSPSQQFSLVGAHYSPLEQFSIANNGSQLFPGLKLEVGGNYSLFSLSCNENHLLWAGDNYVTDSMGISLADFELFSSTNVLLAIALMVYAGSKFSNVFSSYSSNYPGITTAWNSFSILFLVALFHFVTGLFFVFFFHNEIYHQEEVWHQGKDLGEIVWNQTLISQPFLNFFFTLEDVFWGFFVGGLIGNPNIKESLNAFIDENRMEQSLMEQILPNIFLDIFNANSNENAALFLKVATISSFAFYSNLTGLLPYADTLTSSFAVTFGVGLIVFASLLTLLIRKNGVNYFFAHFMPAGCPTALVFLLIPIEVISYSFRLISLAVRLFANMMAGHTLMKTIAKTALDCLLAGADFLILCGYLPLLVLFMLLMLEIAVAFIQAYIFTLLVCLYLREVLPE